MKQQAESVRDALAPFTSQALLYRPLGSRENIAISHEVFSNLISASFKARVLVEHFSMGERKGDTPDAVVTQLGRVPGSGLINPVPEVVGSIPADLAPTNKPESAIGNDKCRAEFEKWMLEQRATKVSMRPEGFYAVPGIHQQWQAYSAAYHRTISAGELEKMENAIQEQIPSLGFKNPLNPYPDDMSNGEWARDIAKNCAKAAVLALGHTIEGE